MNLKELILSKLCLFNWWHLTTSDGVNSIMPGIQTLNVDNSWCSSSYTYYHEVKLSTLESRPWMVTIVDAVVPVPVIIECDAHVWHSYFNAPDAMTCAVCLLSLMYVQTLELCFECECASKCYLLNWIVLCTDTDEHWNVALIGITWFLTCFEMWPVLTCANYIETCFSDYISWF